jgi:hypothetical protein
MRLKLPLLTTLVLAVAAITAAALAASRQEPAASREEPGVCGPFRYWQDGQCTDARERKSGKSWQQEILEKHWKP